MICGKKDQEVAKKGIRKRCSVKTGGGSPRQKCLPLLPPPLPWGWGVTAPEREHMFPSATGMEISARGETWVL